MLPGIDFYHLEYCPLGLGDIRNLHGSIQWVGFLFYCYDSMIRKMMTASRRDLQLNVWYKPLWTGIPHTQKVLTSSEVSKGKDMQKNPCCNYLLSNPRTSVCKVCFFIWLITLSQLHKLYNQMTISECDCW